MPLSQEIQNWVEQMKAAGVPAEVIGPMLPVLESNEKARNALQESVLAQSDYTRKVQAAKQQEDTAKAKLQEANDLLAVNQSWYNENSPRIKAAQDAKEKAENQLAHARTRLQTLKDQGYLTDEQLEGIETSTSAPAPALETQRKYLTQDDMTKQAGVFGVNLTKIQNRINKAWREYDTLFSGTDKAGKFDGEAVIEYVDQKGGKIEDAVEALYGFGARREEIRTATTEQRIKDEAEKLYRQRVSQDIQAGRPVVLPPNASNILKMKPTPEHPEKTPLQRQQERVNRAVAAIESQRTGAAQ